MSKIDVSHGCGEFFLKEDKTIGDFEKVLREHDQQYYTKSGIKHFVPWITKATSQPVFTALKSVASNPGRSCEDEPEGIVYVWSQESKKFENKGSVYNYGK